MRRKLVIIVVLIFGGIWLLNVSRPGPRVEGCLAGCSKTETQMGGGLQIITFNLLHGFPSFEYLPQRLDLIAAELNIIDPDIILLQEVPWTIKTGNAAQYLAEQTGLNYLYLRANGNRWAIFFEEGEAILSRYPLQNPTIKIIHPKARIYENRVALHATAMTPAGDIDLFVTHLTHRNPQINARQVESLFEFVEENRENLTVIGGDFNAPPDSPQIQILQDHWQDVYGWVNPEEEGFTCCTENLTEKLAPHDMRIDYFFLAGLDGINGVSSERVFEKPIQTETGWLWLSDHIGVSTNIEYP